MLKIKEDSCINNLRFQYRKPGKEKQIKSR